MAMVAWTRAPSIFLPESSSKQLRQSAFDWRGRTWNTVGADTNSNAQVSITLKYGSDAVSIDVTGSGDITIDSKSFRR